MMALCKLPAVVAFLGGPWMEEAVEAKTEEAIITNDMDKRRK